MEERLAGGRGSELARKCWEEVMERARRGEIVGLGKGKAEFLRRQRNRDGRDGKGEGLLDFGKLELENRNRQKEERWEKIKGARYNK